MKMIANIISADTIFPNIPGDDTITAVISLWGEDETVEMNVSLKGKFHKNAQQLKITYYGTEYVTIKNSNSLNSKEPMNRDVRDIGVETYDDTQRTQYAQDFESIRIMLTQIYEGLHRDREIKC